MLLAQFISVLLSIARIIVTNIIVDTVTKKPMNSLNILSLIIDYYTVDNLFFLNRRRPFYIKFPQIMARIDVYRIYTINNQMILYKRNS